MDEESFSPHSFIVEDVIVLNTHMKYLIMYFVICLYIFQLALVLLSPFFLIPCSYSYILWFALTDYWRRDSLPNLIVPRHSQITKQHRINTNLHSEFDHVATGLGTYDSMSDASLIPEREKRRMRRCVYGYCGFLHTTSHVIISWLLKLSNNENVLFCKRCYSSVSYRFSCW